MAKILIVDDEIEIRSILKEFLEKNGFIIDEAVDGREAIKILEENDQFDLIILDHRMPKLDGGGVMEELKKKKISIPVILLTGSLGKEAKALNADELFMKPTDLHELLEKINVLIGEKDT